MWDKWEQHSPLVHRTLITYFSCPCHPFCMSDRDMTHYMCGMTHWNLNTWHDAFKCETWRIDMFDMTHSYVPHDSFIWCDMTHSYLAHASSMRATLFLSLSPIKCEWNDSLLCVIQFIRITCGTQNTYDWSYVCEFPSSVCYWHYHLCVSEPLTIFKGWHLRAFNTPANHKALLPKSCRRKATNIQNRKSFAK